MAFRRSVTAGAKFFYLQKQRLAVPLSHVGHHDNDRRRQNYEVSDYLRRRLPGDNWGSFSGSRNLFPDRRFTIPAAYTPVFVRNMSTDGVDVVGRKLLRLDEENDNSANLHYIKAAVAPVANEVAAAAVSGNFPVHELQSLSDYVHTFTGINWWASIAVTTILIRTLLLPFTIHHYKALSKFTLIRPQLLEINREETGSSDESPFPVAIGEARRRKLLNEYGINQFINFASSVMQFIVVSYFCETIVKMTKTIESFKEGGAFWFTDLATSDAICILPILTALTFWRVMECHHDARLGEDASGGYSSLAATLAPVAVIYPKGVLCFWITSNLYGLACGMAMKNPEILKMLGIPNVSRRRDSDFELLLLPASFADWLPVAFLIIFLG